MSAHPQSLGHRIMATGIAAALALTGVITAAGVANAQENRPEYGNINTANRGTIHLHKRESGSQNGATGSVFEKTLGGVPVQGVQFTHYKISGLDLTQPENWEVLKDLNVTEDACTAAKSSDQQARKLGAYNLDAGVNFPKTGDHGDTSVSDLPIGAYLICETDAPDTVKKKAAPFVVTVPSFDEAKGWIYTVHAYPKNTVIQPGVKGVKPVTEYGIQNEEQVTFTIAAKVPQLAKKGDGAGAKDEFFKYFMVADSLHASYVNGKVVSVNLADAATEAGSPITVGHYEKNDSTAPKDGKKHWISVKFTKDGLAFLKENPNKYVIVTITAKVDSVADNGKLTNTGYLAVDTETRDENVPPEPTEPPVTPPDTPGEPPVGGEPTNKVVTLWGQAKLKKHSTDGQSTPLKGAEFEIYHASVQDDSCSGTEIDPAKNTAISINGKSTFPSDDAGIVTVSGLFIDQAEGSGDKEPAPKKSHRCYVFKEVKAPLGYILPKDEKALKGVKVEPGPKTGHNVELSNTPVSVPELPITGASGTVIATVVGTSLLLLAVGAVLVRRRREAIEA